MALEPTGVSLVAEGADAFLGSMKAAGGAVVDFGSSAAGVAGGALKGFATAAAGVAAVTGGALVAGLGAAATAGFGFNNAMEQAEAKINAFTKDAGATAEILDMVKERAAKTPFAFEEMAGAAAALGPVAKSSGEDLEDLIATAEILAASNPAEGLEGAAFALKEATSGDFTSVIERFNLSRQYLNELKDQGVPALEAIGMAMQQAGYDADLVTALAATASGRLSTFTDTFTNLAGTVTQPIFDAFSEGLGVVNDELAEGTPVLEAAAEVLGQSLVPVAEKLGEVMANAATGLVAFVDALTFEDGSLKSFEELWAEFGPMIQEGAAGALQAITDFVAGIGQKILEGLPGVVANLQQIGARLLGWAQEQAPGWLASLQQLGKGLAEWVVTAGPELLGKLLDLRNQLIAWVLDSLPGWAAELDKLRTAAIEWVADALPDLGTNLGKIAALLVEKTGEFIAMAGPKLLELAGMFVTWVATEALPRLPGEMVKIGGALLTGIGNFIAEVAPELIKLGAKFVAWVQEEVLPKAPGELAKIGSAIVKGIGDFIGNVTAEASKIGSALIDGITAGARNAASSLYNAISGIIKSALGAGESTAQVRSPSRLFANELGVPISEGIAMGVTQAAGLVDEAVGTTVTDGLGVATDMAPGIGRAIGDGLAQGIGASVTAVQKAAQKLAGAATGGAKKTLGIASPSQVFADEVGRPIVDGMAAGMLDNLGVLLDAAKEISWAVLDDAKKFAATIQDAVGPILAAGYQGAADFARGQISALDAIDALAPDAGELEKRGQESAKLLDQLGKVEDEYAAKRAKLAEQIAKAEAGLADDDAAARRKALEDELKGLEGKKKDADADLAERRRRLAYTAANNIDPETRRKAQQELAELDAGGAANSPEELARIAAIKAELAGLDRQGAEEQAAARQAEIDRIAALKAELAGLGDAEAQRRAEVQADLALSVARYKEEEERFRALQAVQDKAQADIAAAQAEALKLQDPAERAAFLKLRTGQILEAAKLEQQAITATSQAERDRIAERQKLLLQAQQFDTQLYAQQAKERQAQQAQALRDAEDAIKQLTGLVYFSQHDVFGQGQDVIKGIGAGMLSQVQALSGTLNGALAGVLDSLKRALGIASPSKLFAEQIGGPLMAGIVAGFQQEAARVAPQLQASVTALVQPVQRAAQITAGPAFSDNRSITISAPGATAQTVGQIRQIADGLMRQTTARSDLIRRTR